MFDFTKFSQFLFYHDERVFLSVKLYNFFLCLLIDSSNFLFHWRVSIQRCLQSGLFKVVHVCQETTNTSALENFPLKRSHSSYWCLMIDFLWHFKLSVVRFNYKESLSILSEPKSEPSLSHLQRRISKKLE